MHRCRCLNGSPLATLVRPISASSGPPDSDADWTLTLGTDDGRATDRAISRSRAELHSAELTSGGVRVGVDIETLDRIALNAHVDDDWLSADERRLVAAATEPLLELACHWVLKEAYGKALGIGLALPLGELSFLGKDGRIVLDDPVTRRAVNWAFSLYRRDSLVIGTACRRHRQSATPFAPLGRNPPTPLLDR